MINLSSKQKQTSTSNLAIETYLKHEKIKEILKTWVNIAILNLYQVYFNPYLSLFIPFYDTLYSVFLLWLVVPETKGNLVFFENFIKPFFEQNLSKFQKHIYPLFSNLGGKISSLIEDFVLSNDRYVLKHMGSDELRKMKRVYENRLEIIEGEMYRRNEVIGSSKEVNRMIERNDDNLIEEKNEETGQGYLKQMYDKLLTPKAVYEEKTIETPDTEDSRQCKIYLK